ncbi:MAG: hypothetical protein ACLFRZ_11025 [Rhodosalinus sp.]
MFDHPDELTASTLALRSAIERRRRREAHEALDRMFDATAPLWPAVTLPAPMRLMEDARDG